MSKLPRSALLAAALLLLPLGGLNAAPAPVTVHITNFVFTPADLKVPAGTTVTWVNDDDIPHTIVADDKTAFRSKVLDTGDSFSFTFKAPGAYGYFCSIHPHMTGRVTVT
jgi:plastocyanin